MNKQTPRTNKTPHRAGTQDLRPPLLDLFPPIAPYASGYLCVGDGHNLYWEQSGNPDGIPVVFLHGGPGAGASALSRRFFDPSHYRIVIFDQRGAGRSTPLGSIESNTLPHLIQDIETLRLHLGLERWHVFGGSWGSTLGIAYAQEHPQRCISLILRGIFLLEQGEIDWFMYGMRTLFPEAWEQFASLIPEDDQYDLLESYYDLLINGTQEQQTEAAIRWASYEGACSSLIPTHEDIISEEEKLRAWALARMEAHYFRNNMISVDQSLMNRVDRLRSIPATIVHGRYDVICPVQTAHKLHLLWPEADYIVVPDGGHSAMDPTIRSRLIEATEHAKKLR